MADLSLTKVDRKRLSDCLLQEGGCISYLDPEKKLLIRGLRAKLDNDEHIGRYEAYLTLTTCEGARHSPMELSKALQDKINWIIDNETV